MPLGIGKLLKRVAPGNRADEAELQPGSLVKSYTVERRLGRGQFAIVSSAPAAARATFGAAAPCTDRLQKLLGSAGRRQAAGASCRWLPPARLAAPPARLAAPAAANTDRWTTTPCAGVQGAGPRWRCVRTQAGAVRRHVACRQVGNSPATTAAAAAAAWSFEPDGTSPPPALCAPHCRVEAVNELRLLASLRHPNLVQYNEAFVEVGRHRCIPKCAPVVACGMPHRRLSH